MIWQKLYRDLVRQHSHLDWEEFSMTLAYDIGIINKFIEKENN